MSTDISAYLKRVHYELPLFCDEPTLFGLHRAQRLSIPFDMLDVHLKIPLSLDEDYIFQKLIKDRRGGGCSQLNELLAMVLIQLGFKVERLLARVIESVPIGHMPQISHKILKVSSGDSQWLSDVGYGGNALFDPLPWVLNKPFEQPSGEFRLISDKKLGYVLEKFSGTRWQAIYCFDETVYYPEDFMPIMYYNALSRKMGFSKDAIITLPLLNGWKKMKNNKFLKMEDDTHHTFIIHDAKTYHATLNKEFNICLPEHLDFFPNKGNK